MLSGTLTEAPSLVARAKARLPPFLRRAFLALYTSPKDFRLEGLQPLAEAGLFGACSSSLPLRTPGVVDFLLTDWGEERVSRCCAEMLLGRRWLPCGLAALGLALLTVWLFSSEVAAWKAPSKEELPDAQAAVQLAPAQSEDATKERKAEEDSLPLPQPRRSPLTKGKPFVPLLLGLAALGMVAFLFSKRSAADGDAVSPEAPVRSSRNALKLRSLLSAVAGVGFFGGRRIASASVSFDAQKMSKVECKDGACYKLGDDK